MHMGAGFVLSVCFLFFFFLGFWLFLFVDLFDLRRRERFSFFLFLLDFLSAFFLESKKGSSVGEEVGRTRKERGKNTI